MSNMSFSNLTQIYLFLQLDIAMETTLKACTFCGEHDRIPLSKQIHHAVAMGNVPYNAGSLHRTPEREEKIRHTILKWHLSQTSNH